MFDKPKVSKPVNPPTLLTKVTPALFKFNVVTPLTKIVACNLPPFKLNAVTLTEVAPKEVNHATNVDWSITPTKPQLAVISKLKGSTPHSKQLMS